MNIQHLQNVAECQTTKINTDIYVAKWYNFSFRVTRGGCTNQDEFEIDEAQNHRTDSLLKKRIGKNWRVKFVKKRR